MVLSVREDLFFLFWIPGCSMLDFIMDCSTQSKHVRLFSVRTSCLRARFLLFLLFYWASMFTLLSSEMLLTSHITGEDYFVCVTPVRATNEQKLPYVSSYFVLHTYLISVFLYGSTVGADLRLWAKPWNLTTAVLSLPEYPAIYGCEKHRGHLFMKQS